MSFGIIVSGVARYMVATSSRTRAQDTMLIGTALGAASGTLRIALRISPFVTTQGMLSVAGER